MFFLRKIFQTFVQQFLKGKTVKANETNPANLGRKVQMVGGIAVIESSNKVKWKKKKYIFSSFFL